VRVTLLLGPVIVDYAIIPLSMEDMGLTRILRLPPADVTQSCPSHTTTTMPVSLSLLMPTVLAKASEHTRSDLQQRWNSCTSAQEYRDAVRSTRASATPQDALQDQRLHQATRLG